jgi:bacteriocin biosynthesis cyclodehydratase domain-containing protein
VKEVTRFEDRDRRPADRGRVGLLQGDLSTDCGPPAGPASGPHYRLRPSVEAFVDRDGVLCFVVPGRQHLVVRDPDDVDVALVRALRDDWSSPATLAGSTGADLPLVVEKLDSLDAADLVLRRASPESSPLIGDDAERFSRQLPYLAELGDENQLQRRLRECVVVVLGCGGLGTWAIAALACIGVGKLVLVDDDEVALSNLNRQILYTAGDVGVPKVTATEAWLNAFDPAIEVTTLMRRVAAANDVEPIIDGADAVVLAADWPPYRIARWVNAACVVARTPFIVAGQVPPVLKLGPTYVPGVGACFACHESALTRDSYAYEDYVATRIAEPAVASTVGPASCVAGGLMGLELMHLLTGNRPATQGLAMTVHMQTLEVQRIPIARDPDCAACKHLQ